MLQQMIEQEERERKMHLKNAAPKDVLTPAVKEVSVPVQSKPKGFARQGVTESFRGPGSPPAEAVFDAAELNYEVSPELLTTIERYNIVMNFMAKHCKST